MGTILILILVLVLIGALPAWPHSRNWGYYPSGGRRIDPFNSNHPATSWEDLKRFQGMRTHCESV